MCEGEKKTGVWPWIVVLLIGLPVLYVASFGPACWLTSREFPGDIEAPQPIWMNAFIPVGKLADRGCAPLEWYARLGLKKGIVR
jgi:hypothetical protein